MHMRQPLIGRLCTGDFIVDDDGMGYADYGEDDWQEDGGDDAEETQPSPDQEKKRKKGNKDGKGDPIGQDGVPSFRPHVGSPRDLTR